MKDGSRVKNRLTGKGRCIPHLRSMTSKALSFEEQNPETACPSHLRPLSSWPGVPPLPHTETAPPGRLGMTPTGQESSAKLCAWALLPVQGKHINTDSSADIPILPTPQETTQVKPINKSITSGYSKETPLPTFAELFCDATCSPGGMDEVRLSPWGRGTCHVGSQP